MIDWLRSDIEGIEHPSIQLGIAGEKHLQSMQAFPDFESGNLWHPPNMHFQAGAGPTDVMNRSATPTPTWITQPWKLKALFFLHANRHTK